MNPKTVQLLGTLEVFLENRLFCILPYNHASSWQPFAWDSAENGALNVMNLLLAEGWMHLTDPEVAVESWQQIERRGTATEDDESYAPEWEERENILDPETYELRAEYYQELYQLIQSRVKQLKALKLCCSTDFACYVILGETETGDWLCIAPTVPQETPDLGDIIVTEPCPNSEFKAAVQETALSLKGEIDNILSDLTPISIYGHYEGSYDHTYDHKIVCEVAATDKLALQAALLSSGFLTLGQFRELYPNPNDYLFNGYSRQEEGERLYQRYRKLNDFLQRNFPQMVMYRLRFWDMEQIYLVSQPAGDDWAGLKLASQFYYNP
ncbi:hypothetical protein [Kamptonema formosum]|uniref:hypothetical protein n=1 Tax=Kamptonema formosum TaxID=331992 RepID=UPI00037631A1|nr:hypothetical protein [Oscillatoria sp. PCC 10802]